MPLRDNSDDGPYLSFKGGSSVVHRPVLRRVGAPIIILGSLIAFTVGMNLMATYPVD
jgi:hypothetical protein